ncbi:hypothetical protein RHS03_08048, partial [Rhizoctonia solani]
MPPTSNRLLCPCSSAPSRLTSLCSSQATTTATGVTPRQAQFNSQLEDQPTKPECGHGLRKRVPTKCLSQYSKERQQSARIQQGKEQKSKRHGKDKGKTRNGSANTQPHKGQMYINDARVSDNKEQLELDNPTFCNRFIHTLEKVLGQSFKHESKETLKVILDNLHTDQATQNATQGGYPEVFGLLTQVLGELATAFMLYAN